MHVGSHVHRNLEFFDGERPEVQETTGASVQLSEWLPIGTDDDFIGEPCRRCGSASGRRSWPDIRRGERGGWVVGSRAMRWSSAWAVVPVRMAANSASPTAPVTLYLVAGGTAGLINGTDVGADRASSPSPPCHCSEPHDVARPLPTCRLSRWRARRCVRRRVSVRRQRADHLFRPTLRRTGGSGQRPRCRLQAIRNRVGIEDGVQRRNTLACNRRDQ